MPRIDLAQTITIIANLGVIAGIVFLGVELHQTQQLSRAQTQTEIANARMELMQSDLAGPIVDILVRVSKEEPLTPADSIRLSMWTDSWLSYYEHVYFQNRFGLYDEDVFDANMREIEFWFTDESAVAHFCGRRKILSARFVAAIDEMLEQPCG